MQGLNFQDVIMRLDQYWAEQGCLVVQPYDIEVGAGTMAPATFLRVLGPEPWNVAYPQPTRRPTDGRYAKNPNRYQHYFQYQVILKPAPGDPLGMYLRSLAALGISDRDHDVRFVEDNWESPSLGAWGLGWEVWLDGLEITQFTYFQQSGNRDLDPPSVEITYGLERIAMYLQGVRDFTQIRWNDRVTYGDLYRQSEVEQSTYNFEIADVDGLKARFDLYEAEARRTLDAGLVSPGMEQVLKCSHTFNLLDARGVVSVQQRANYLGRMRTLARRGAAAFLEQREQAGFPLLGTADARSAEPATASASSAHPAAAADPARRDDLVIELGVEELPADDLTSALDQLRASVPRAFGAAGLEHGAVVVAGTPRRIAVTVAGVGVREAVREEVVKGPPAAAAFDKDGTPTRAAEGFARSAGVTVDRLSTQEIGGRAYVVATKRTEAPPATEQLASALADALGALKFGRQMYWDTPKIVFSRPVRWLVALWGDEVVPAEYAGVRAGRTTLPPRGSDGAVAAIESAGDYAATLERLGVVLDVAARRKAIVAQSRALAETVNGHIEGDQALLDEVANLVEWPTPILGSFEPASLDAPAAALVTVMKKHQRYFPIHGADGRLLPHFVAVANGKRERVDLIRVGNEEVLRARFADALYFYRQDLERPLEAFVPQLGQLTFIEGLGSLLDKTERLVALAPAVGTALGIEADTRRLERAARLAKADLATGLVKELTELQGEMGREYARAAGEPDDVAEAIREHYLPRVAGDALPAGDLGTILGVADRVDTLTGAFAAGLEPTGSSDPYGLRRVALGLIVLLAERGIAVSLARLIDLAAPHAPVTLADERRDALLAFLRQRLRVWLAEQGRSREVIESVLAAQGDMPSLAVRTVSALEGALGSDDFQRLMVGVKRADRIAPRDRAFDLDAAALVEPAERDLLAAYTAAQQRVAAVGADDVDGLVRALLPLADPIDRFFGDVMVMAEDERLRSARLGLLQRIRDLPRRSFEVAQVPTAR